MASNPIILLASVLIKGTGNITLIVEKPGA